MNMLSCCFSFSNRQLRHSSCLYFINCRRKSVFVSYIKMTRHMHPAVAGSRVFPEFEPLRNITFSINDIYDSCPLIALSLGSSNFGTDTIHLLIPLYIRQYHSITLNSTFHFKDHIITWLTSSLPDVWPSSTVLSLCGHGHVCWMIPGSWGRCFRHSGAHSVHSHISK